jgi:hypothetical protein
MLRLYRNHGVEMFGEEARDGGAAALEEVAVGKGGGGDFEVCVEVLLEGGVHEVVFCDAEVDVAGWVEGWVPVV